MIPNAIANNKPIWVASGHALGKDYLSGGLPLWWQETNYPATTVITGPTDRQVKEIVWRELESHYHNTDSKVPIGGRLLKGKLEWYEKHFIIGFTTSKSEQSIGRAQGIHSPNVLIIVTEGQAIDETIYDQLDGLTTSGRTLMIVMGNPLVTTGRFARMLRDPINNYVVHMDCEDSPNVKEGREVIPGMCSRAWVEDKRRRWYDKDPNHPLWLSKVKGQLPKSAVTTVFSMDMLERATDNRPALWHQDVCAIGLDPAAFGDDESAFYANRCGIVDEYLTTGKMEPTDTAGRAAILRQKHRASVIAVDTDGLGEGVASMLRELKQPGWDVISVKGSTKPDDPDNSPYLNRRAQMWFWARDQMTQGRVSIPDDDALKEELTEVNYYYNRRGKIQLEPKDDVKERLGRSPDRADGWILSVWGLRFAKPMPRNRLKDYHRKPVLQAGGNLAG